jgi:hypothetical protein
MDVMLGDLTFLTDGNDYSCIWSPPGTTHDHPAAVPIALISTRLIADAADFKRWQEDINTRWLATCARVFGADMADLHVEPIKGKDTH